MASEIASGMLRTSQMDAMPMQKLMAERLQPFAAVMGSIKAFIT